MQFSWLYNKQRELYKCEDNNNPWNKYIEPIEHIYQQSLRCDKFICIPCSTNLAV